MLTALSINRGGLGRLGNQMFTIAGVIGIAINSNQSYGFPEWVTKDNEIFGQPADNINDFLLKPLPSIPEGMTFQQYPYFWGYKDIYLPHDNWSIDAHMQSKRFFAHCLPLIREIFTFKDEPKQNEAIAIHVRFGDYIQDEYAHHPVCTRNYYLDALNYLNYNGAPVSIFSDEPKRAFDLLDLPYYEKDYSSNYIEDFKLMKSCKHFITSNSSYSLMAAILGNHRDKKIITPSRWFGKSMPPEFDTKDIYPAEAVII